MELASGVLFDRDGHVEVIEGIVELVQLKVDKSSEEIKGGISGVVTGGSNGHIQEVESLGDLLPLELLVDVVFAHGQGVTAHDADDIQTVGILVIREPKRSLAEILRRHQEVLGVHLENASAQPFVVGGGVIHLLLVKSLGSGDVLQGVLVFLNSHVSV